MWFCLMCQFKCFKDKYPYARVNVDATEVSVGTAFNNRIIKLTFSKAILIFQGISPSEAVT